jgi:hypothetical protein
VSSLFSIARSLMRDKRLAVLLLLAITLFAQAIALDAENHAHQNADHCCLLCHVCAPALEASVPLEIAPLAYLRWLAPDRRADFLRDVFRPTCSSRGPPAIS